MASLVSRITCSFVTHDLSRLPDLAAYQANMEILDLPVIVDEVGNSPQPPNSPTFHQSSLPRRSRRFTVVLIRLIMPGSIAVSPPHSGRRSPNLAVHSMINWHRFNSHPELLFGIIIWCSGLAILWCWIRYHYNYIQTISSKIIIRKVVGINILVRPS